MDALFGTALRLTRNRGDAEDQQAAADEKIRLGGTMHDSGSLAIRGTPGQCVLESAPVGGDDSRQQQEAGWQWA